MKYVALLRGINVGGNNKVKMSDLKILFEGEGLKNIKTYINSGNVLFETEENIEKVTEELERKILKDLNVSSPIVTVSSEELENITDNAPKTWKKTDDLRKYVAFVKKPHRPEDVMKEIETREGVDSIDKGPGVIYMSTTLEGITKSKLSRHIGKPTYKLITIRNFNTVEKLLKLCGTI